MDLATDLVARGLVHQTTAGAVEEVFAEGPLTAYIGFDPTAASLHVGSLLPVMLLVRLQRAGHRPLALVGGGTGLIGDPSGKASERSMLSEEQLAVNLAGLRSQLERFLDFSGERGAVLVDNAEWLRRLPLLAFLRDIGKHFSVNAMIARDSVKNRLESREHGISYTEFSYSLLQAYDFLELYDRYGCRLQMGGSDQWGNIVAGADLVRRLRGVSVHGLTSPLVTRADGSKFGKSEQGNVWLDERLTSPYDFYQFWLNTEDADVGRWLRAFTLLELAEIEELDRSVAERPQERAAQRRLAEEVTRLVHGEAALTRSRHVSEVLFEGRDLAELSAEQLDEAFRSIEGVALPREALGTAAAGLTGLLASAGLCPSKGEARRAIEGGGVYVNNRRIAEPNLQLTAEHVLAGGFVVLRRGRKSYQVVRVA
jgi:tyrosyl-tRNA synthetase